MEGSVLGIDVGTTGVKAIILDPVGLLHHTAGDGNDESRPASFQMAKRTQIPKQFKLRVLSDGTGVEEN